MLSKSWFLKQLCTVVLTLKYLIKQPPAECDETVACHWEW